MTDSSMKFPEAENILLINVDDTPQLIGGIKRVCITLAQYWVQFGFDLCFVCIKDKEKKYDTIAGFPQVHLPDTDRVLSKTNISYLQSFVLKNKIDIIFNPFMDCKEVTRLCFEVSKASNVKLVTAWHFSPTHIIDIVDNSFFIRYKNGSLFKRYLIDFLLWVKWFSYKRHKIDKLRSAYFRDCIEKSDKVVFLSRYYLPVVEQMVGYRSDKVAAIVNPHSLEVGFDDFSKKEKIVLWAGRLGYDAKRTDKMLSIWKKVCSKHADWKLVICGSGNSDYFRKLCIKFSIENVEIPGFVNMDEYYSKSSIFCNTSVTEGLPMVLLEALGYGCVPMSFDNFASVHDIIEDGENGYIIPAFDEKEYARKLDLLMTDEDLRMTMAHKGRESVNHFNPEAIARKWIELFQSL